MNNFKSSLCAIYKSEICWSEKVIIGKHCTHMIFTALLLSFSVYFRF